MNILNADFAPDQYVCWHTHKTWREFQDMTAGFYHQLHELQGAQCLLYCQSAYHFAAALLGCWQRRIIPVVAPDMQTGTVEKLREHVHGVLTDVPLSFPGMPVVQPRVSPRRPRWHACIPEAIALYLLTSGTTGERRMIAKTFAQLHHELESLGRTLGGFADGTPRFSTVSHLHIYGLFFRVLWPLCSGDPFLERNSFYWEEMFGLLPDGPATIVSSPSHLRHFSAAARDAECNWKELRIFSSGGPLPRQVALEIAETCAHAPMEVFGSTETGGIAYRQQRRAEDVPWTPLADVSVKISEGLLFVHSPMIDEDVDWHPTSDLAVQARGNTFYLQGRADRIVKLSEKRISLQKMESCLRSHAWVEEARVFLFPGPAGSRHKKLAAVIVLNGDGKRELEDGGRAPLVEAMKTHVLHDFEPSAVPHWWRFPDAMPYQAQGKVSMDSLYALFARAPGAVTEPAVLSRRANADGFDLVLQVPENLFYLHGHFPGLPVVAGVCQLQWIIAAIEAHIGRKLDVAGMEWIKFHSLLMPGQVFHVHARRDAARDKWHYSLFDENRSIASGRIVVRT